MAASMPSLAKRVSTKVLLFWAHVCSPQSYCQDLSVPCTRSASSSRICIDHPFDQIGMSHPGSAVEPALSLITVLIQNWRECHHPRRYHNLFGNWQVSNTHRASKSRGPGAETRFSRVRIRPLSRAFCRPRNPSIESARVAISGKLNDLFTSGSVS